MDVETTISVQQLEDIDTAEKCEAWPTMGSPCWKPAKWMAIKACGCSLLMCDRHKAETQKNREFPERAACSICGARDVTMSVEWIKL